MNKIYAVPANLYNAIKSNRNRTINVSFTSGSEFLDRMDMQNIRYYYRTFRKHGMQPMVARYYIYRLIKIGKGE